MAIDVNNETVLSLANATKAVPAIGGKHPHTSTLWRWCRKGIRGVKLEYARYGNRIVTSTEALSRFVNNLAAADIDLNNSASPPTPKITHSDSRRSQSVCAAKDRLARAGI